MPTIGRPPAGRLPKPRDRVTVTGRTPEYIVCPPGTVERGLNVWCVRIRPRNSDVESWALLSNITVIKPINQEAGP